MEAGRKIILGLALAAGIALTAGAESLTLSQIILRARENNPTLMEAQNTLRSAENDLTGDLRLDNSSLRASGDWSLESDKSSSSDNPSGSLTLTVPVIDQVSLSGSVASNQDISAALSLSPFNLTSTRISSEASYGNARASLLFTEAALDWDVLNLALALALAEKQQEVYRQLEQLENDQYEASYALYLAGDITYDDLLDAMDELTTAEDNSLAGEDSLLAARQELQTAIGLSGDFTLEELTLEETEALKETLASRIGSMQAESVSSPDVTQARNALILAQRERDITLTFQPDLSFSAGVSGNLESPSDTAGELSVSLTLSGSSFNATERDILSSEVKVKEAELSQALLEGELEKESLVSAREQAAKATETAKRDRERYQILADETSLLYGRGERTVLENTEAELQLQEAENTLFARYIGEIYASADYLGLYPESDIDLIELLEE